MPDGVTLTITGVEEVMSWLDKVSHEYRDASIAGTTRWLNDLAAKIQENIRSLGLVQSGALLRGVTVEVAGVTAAEWEGNILISVAYAEIHEYGGTIKAARKFLVFVNDRTGDFVYTNQAVIPARPFIAPALAEMEDKLEQYIADEIERRGLGGE